MRRLPRAVRAADQAAALTVDHPFEAALCRVGVGVIGRRKKHQLTAEPRGIDPVDRDGCHGGPVIRRRRLVLQDEGRRRFEPREDEIHARLVARDANRAAGAPCVAHEPAVDRHHACRVAVRQEEPGVDRRDWLMARGDVADRLHAHDLVIGEDRLQIDSCPVESKHPHRERARWVDQRRRVHMVQKHAGRDVTGLGEVEWLGARCAEEHARENARPRDVAGTAARKPPRPCHCSSVRLLLHGVQSE